MSSRFACPECGEKRAVHDTVEKRWRHLNFFQYECELVARVPLARAGSGFTLMFEAAVMVLAREMPGEIDTRLWRLIVARIGEAHAQSDWSEVRAIAIDETSVRKGWNYVTVILGADTRRLLHLAPGRSGEALQEFRKACWSGVENPSKSGTS